jgi:hypothetical protein
MAAEATTRITGTSTDAMVEVPAIPGDGPVKGHSDSSSTVKPLMAAGVVMDNDHTRWWNGHGPLVNVTRVVEVVDRSGALTYWSKQTVADFAVASFLNGELQRHVMADGNAATSKWLASLPDYQKDAAASIGTSVHLLAHLLGADEKAADGFPLPEGTQPYLDAFRGFLGRYGASNIISSEKHVIHLGMRYGGQYDLLMLIDGELWLIDIKTGRGPKLSSKAMEASGAFYPETALQLAAYGYAEFIGLLNDPTPYPMPLIQRYGVLHLRPDKYPDTGYRLIPYDVTERTFFAFTSAWDLYQWKQGR